MASFADLKPIIVITCFLSLFLFLTTQMASSPEIWTTEEQQRIVANEDFSAYNLLYWNATNGTTIHNDVGWTDDGMMGDVEVKLYTYAAPLTYPLLQMDSYTTWTGWVVSMQTNFEHFQWYNITDKGRLTLLSHDASEDPTYMGVPAHGIRIQDLDLWYEDSLNNLRFYIWNSRTSSDVAFHFNTSKYGSPGAAWISDELFVSFSNNYSEKQSGLNAFELITGLMFWRLPNIPTEIYVLFTFIIWPPLIYVAAIWILRIIGSVFGGGGGG